MKSILISIRLYYFYCTYKGIKIEEIRKKFPLNYKGKIYEYVSKTNWKQDLMKIPTEEREFFKQFVGKVGLCFECDKVEKWDIWQDDLEEKLKLAYLSVLDFDKYSKGQVAYAIHIAKLEIFDKPKEISEFRKLNTPTYEQTKPFAEMFGDKYTKEEYLEQCKKFGFLITKAPQNYCYVEVEE